MYGVLTQQNHPKERHQLFDKSKVSIHLLLGCVLISRYYIHKRSNKTPSRTMIESLFITEFQRVQGEKMQGVGF